MNERVLTIWNGIRDKWNAFDRNQKIKIVVITAAVILAIGLTVFLLTRPKYVVLVNDFDVTTLAQTEAALEANGIAYKNTNSGLGIMVLERDKPAAKRVYMSSNIPGKDKYKFEDALADQSMSITGRMQKEQILRANESEIEVMLEGLDYVNVATVKLSLPDEANVFLNKEEVASAAVTVNTGATQATRKQGEVIASLVAASCMDLLKENVTVTDQNGNYLYAGVSEDSLSGAAASNQEYANAYERTLVDKIEKSFSPFGDYIYVVPYLQFDFTRIHTKSTEFSSPDSESTNTGLIDQERTQSSTATNVNPDGEAGPGTNNNETPDYALQNGTTSSGSSKEKETAYLYNKKEMETDNLGNGALLPESSSMTVHIIKEKYYYESTISADTLNGLTWDEFKSNTDLVRTNAYPELPDSLRTASGLDNVTLLTFDKPVFVDREVTAIPWQTIIMLLILAVLLILLAYGLIKKTQPDEITEIEPDLTVEDLLVSTQLEEEKEKSIEKTRQELAEIEFGEDSEIKKQIMKFVDDKPEAVAQLLRNWINEDWE